VPGLQVLDAVQAGTIEAGHTASYWYIGKEPGFAFFTAIPFGLNTRQLTAWLRHGGGNQLADQLFAEYNIQAFPCGDTGAQMGGWFRQEIRTPQDVQGLKFRISGLAGQVFQRMGASPTLVAPADIYPSLERGTIDATEFVGPHDDERLGFFRVARFYYAPGWFEPAARLHFMSNKRAYDALPQQYKEALMIACSDADAEMVSRYDHLNPIALRRLVAQGTQLRFYSREILQLAWRSNEALMADLAGQNPRFRTIWMPTARIAPRSSSGSACLRTATTTSPSPRPPRRTKSGARVPVRETAGNPAGEGKADPGDGGSRGCP
jgi:TRAP-type mannitol/chloroaromatic compound transport system substrate-binding protein